MSRSRLDKIVLHLEYLLFLLRKELKPKPKRRTPNKKRKRGE